MSDLETSSGSKLIPAMLITIAAFWYLASLAGIDTNIWLVKLGNFALDALAMPQTSGRAMSFICLIPLVLGLPRLLSRDNRD